MLLVPLVANIPPPPFRDEDGFAGFEIGPLDLRLYGILIAIGAYLALLLVVKRYRDMGGDPELAERTALIAIVSAIVGSRIGFVIPRLDHFLANPAEIPQIWRGGLAFFGGVALATPTCWWYVHRRGGDVARMVDAAAPALPLGHAIGRWGNYFNQELYGRPTDLPWALEVEAQRRVTGFGQFETFHPTFLYESLWNLALVGVLLWLSARRRDSERLLRHGSLGFLYLAGYGAGRFWTEWLRIDVPDTYLGLSRNGWNSVLVIVIGVLGIVWWERRGRRTTDGTDADLADDDAAAEGDGDDALAPDESADAPAPRDHHDESAGDERPEQSSPTSGAESDDAGTTGHGIRRGRLRRRPRNVNRGDEP